MKLTTKKNGHTLNGGNNRYLSLLFIFLSLLTVTSCIPHRRMVYFQNRDVLPDTVAFVKPAYKIKSGDILNIQVITLDEKSHTLFNNDRSVQRTTQTGGGGIGNSQMYLWGYNVDENGRIKMPVVGDVAVAGKTLIEATDYISERVADYLISATVLIKLVNFSVTVMGEVRSPGKYYIYDNDVTIYDVIAVSGELTEFANRTITIVRQTGHGAVFGSLNLNEAAALKSEFFYLQPDDIVYIEPHQLKRFGISQFPISLLFSTISLSLLLMSYFR
jgi:polysaccharide biosynthesis/export protein